MGIEKAWSWSCPNQSSSVLEGKHLDPCFSNIVLIALPAVLVILTSLSITALSHFTQISRFGEAQQILHNLTRQRQKLPQLFTLAACLCLLLSFLVNGPQVHRLDKQLAFLCGLASWLVTFAWNSSPSLKRAQALVLQSKTYFLVYILLVVIWLTQTVCLILDISGSLSTLGRDKRSSFQVIFRILAGAFASAWCIVLLIDLHALAQARRQWNSTSDRLPSLACLLDADLQFVEGNEPNSEKVKPFSPFFRYVGALLKRGSRRRLEFDDLFKLDPELEPNHSRQKIWLEWTQERARKDTLSAENGKPFSPSLFWTLARVCGWPYLGLVVLKLVNDAFNFTGPILLNRLVAYISERDEGQAYPSQSLESSSSQKLYKGFLYAFLLGLCTFIKAILGCQYDYLQKRLGCRLRAGLTCVVFDKSLTLNSANLAEFSSGAVQTLMSVDADRVVGLCPNIIDLWSLPIQIIITLILLYTQVRFAFVAAVAVVILLIPINYVLAKKIEKASEMMMSSKDVRVKRIGEMLRGMKQIKAAAWEPCFTAAVLQARDRELYGLAVMKYLDALCVVSWATTPILMSFFTFSLFVVLGHELDATIVFTSLALFNMLIAPLNSFPWVVNGIVEATVSLRRLERFLAAPELKNEWIALPENTGMPRIKGSSFEFARPNHQSLKTPLLNNSKHGSGTSTESCDTEYNFLGPAYSNIRSGFGSMQYCSPSSHAMDFEGASFSWQADPAQRKIDSWSLREGDVLKNLSLSLPIGKLTVVHGAVGSGKSSLLAAALGELSTTSGSVRVFGSLAYVQQQPWLLSGTIRENILFGAQEDRQRYQEVLQACALERDLEQMKLGDACFVGPRGVTLSGGQQARIALARAIYQDADIYLLDDVLAAVDPPVANWLLENAICGPLLRNKTRLICTHSTICMGVADMVVKLSRGTLQGNSGRSRDSQSFFEPSASMNSEDALRGSLSRQQSFASSDSSIYSSSVDTRQNLSRHLKDFDDLEDRISGNLDEVLESQSIEDDTVENREIGHVKWSIYRRYISSMGAFLAITILASLVLMQASENGNDLWLSFWVSRVSPVYRLQIPHTAIADITNYRQIPMSYSFFRGDTAQSLINESPTGSLSLSVSSNIYFFLKILMLFAAFNAIFTLVRAFSFASGGLVAAEIMHLRLLNAIVKAPLKFFDSIPTGRILNRFSSDTETIDDDLPFIANILLASIAALLGLLIVLAYSQPFILLVFMPLGFVYHSIQGYYRNTARELRRLNNIARTPVYNGFEEVLEGGPTIRACNQQARFATLNETAVTQLQQTTIADGLVAQWLALRLQIITAILVTAIAFLAVFTRLGFLPGFGHGHGTSAGLVGLSLSYALPITSLLNEFLTTSAETEQEMVSVERVEEYCKIQPQAETLTAQPNSGILSPLSAYWPQSGNIAFLNLGLQYIPQGPWVLRKVNLNINAGEKVGFVGRTGAGKSSLISLIVRLTEASEGTILIDGFDVNHIALQHLRSSIGFVSQTPFLFEGTIRQNLDPMKQYTDRDMISVLKHVRLWEILCGISLAQPKADDESSQHSGHRLSASMQKDKGPKTPSLQIPRKAPPKSPLQTPTESWSSPKSLQSSAREIPSLALGRPPISSPRYTYQNQKPNASGPDSKPSTSAPVTGQASRQNASSSAPTRIIKARLGTGQIMSEAQSSSLENSQRDSNAALDMMRQSGAPSSSKEFRQDPRDTSVPVRSRLTAEIQPDRLGLISDRSTLAQKPQNPVGPDKQARSQHHRTRRRDSTTRLSRVLGFGSGPLTEEDPSVLLHAGFGMQLLSLRLGENGIGLSVGQQQLLCLARALLKQPKILLLDECTASVDPYTANAVQRLVNDQLPDCTVIQIAHRLESIMDYDRVVVMEAGEVVEDGVPNRLALDRNSSFYKLIYSTAQ